MNASVEAPRKIRTEAELQALPEDGFIHELVDGEIVMSPKNVFFHSDICSELAAALRSFAKLNHLGAVLESNAGFRMSNSNIRAPDVSFISRARLEAKGFKRSTRRFFPGAPDLAVEVLSLRNTRKEINERLQDFFSGGTRAAWIIDPGEKRVEICHSLAERQWVGEDRSLNGEDLLPGFSYPISDLFKPWDWE